MISPLLANIALHGMEMAVKGAFKGKEGNPNFVRYADDFVIFHPTEAGILKAKTIVEEWIKDIGLELKPSKTRITHTLSSYQGTTGFDFLGWTVRQFPVGKCHTGKAKLGFKIIIKPSKEAVQRHTSALKVLIKKNRNAPQGQLIKEVNRVVRGWTNYHKTVVATATFQHCRQTLFQHLQEWAQRRHPNKGKGWVINKYWHVAEGKGWHFTDGKAKLWTHDLTHIQRHIKVKGSASPYDGNLHYWSTRLSKHPLLNGVKGKLLKKQAGKCRWCGLLFHDEDVIEIDHITPKSQGGGEQLSNKCALHRHCHDERHRKRVAGTSDKGQIIEEPDASKWRTSGSEDEYEG